MHISGFDDLDCNFSYFFTQLIKKNSHKNRKFLFGNITKTTENAGENFHVLELQVKFSSFSDIILVFLLFNVKVSFYFSYTTLFHFY